MNKNKFESDIDTSVPKFKDQKTVTYEDLEKSNIDSLKKNEPLLQENELINKNAHLSNEIRMHYFDKNKKFTNDEVELKIFYDEWHKILGNFLYDKYKNEFNRKSQAFTSSNIIRFLTLHPNLTLKDKKKIDKIKHEIQLKYFYDFVVFYSIGLIMFGIYFKYRLKAKNLLNLFLKNKLRAGLILLTTTLFYDVNFKMNVKKELENQINAKNLKQYFNEYL